MCLIKLARWLKTYTLVSYLKEMQINFLVWCLLNKMWLSRDFIFIFL